MEANKARRAYNILSHMRSRYAKQGKEHCKPNVVIYTSVINACSCPALRSEHDEAFQIAQLTLDELLYNPQFGRPNFLTFSAFLRVCATTLAVGPDRDAIVRSIFTKACEEGQVGRPVVEKLKNSASGELYEQLLIESGIEQTDGSLKFPRSWTRNMDKRETSIPKRRQVSNTKTEERSRDRPELARLQRVRFLSGSTGSYSKDQNDASISFEQQSF
jgi:hypothetical protein